MMVVRHATTKDVTDWYGEPAINRMRAIIGEKDGVAIAIAGLSFRQGLAVAFCDMKPEAFKYKKSIVIASREFTKMMKDFGGRIIAIADENINNSSVFLYWLGFKFVEMSDGVEIYEWRS